MIGTKLIQQIFFNFINIAVRNLKKKTVYCEKIILNCDL